MWRKDTCKGVRMYVKLEGLRVYITDCPRARGRNWTYGIYLNSKKQPVVSEFWVEPGCHEPSPTVKSKIIAKAVVILKKPFRFVESVQMDLFRTLNEGPCTHDRTDYVGEEPVASYCELGHETCKGCEDRS